MRKLSKLLLYFLMAVVFVASSTGTIDTAGALVGLFWISVGLLVIARREAQGN